MSGYLSSKSKTRNDAVKHVAIFGSGITGLSTAWFLTRLLPFAKITIYESGEKVGGWLKSDYVPVEGGKVLFESGPRTLRAEGPSSRFMLHLVSFSSLAHVLD